MHRLLNAAVFAAVAGAASLVLSPAAHAAPAGEPTCVTKSEEIKGARGDIKVCLDDGKVRVSGTLADTLPGRYSDAICAAWWIDWTTTSGDRGGFGPVVCGHFTDPDERTFDYDPSAGEYGIKGITGVKGVHLTHARV